MYDQQRELEVAATARPPDIGFAVPADIWLGNSTCYLPR